MRFKTLFVITLLFALAACEYQEPRLPAQPPVPAVLASYMAEPAVTPQIIDKPAVPELGAVDLDIMAYGATNVGGSTKPSTPLEYRIKIAQARAGSPPLTNAYNPTIFLTVIYSDGEFDLFGTPDVPGILPSNQFTYDPAKERWVNDKGLSQGGIGMQRFVGIVHWNGKTVQLQETVNVR